jgi:amino acid adenylation domain-containing protein/non-ribosomal peptide synthase protein (TIGR01720 family)
MIPSAFVPLDVLPLLPNGKLDRRALPAPVQLSREDEYIAPRTPTEEMLAGIWAQVLNVARVGVHDNFFDLGGHSLLATQLISRIRNAFNVELPLRALFETPTLAELARQIENAQRVPAPPIERIARDRTIPLSFAQQRLWVLDQLDPHSAVYNIPVAAHITGALDCAALERAFNALIRRHETFRTAIITTNGQPAQVIAPELAFTLNVTAARDLDHARQLATELAREPFDLARAPLFRARLVRLRDDDHVLVLTMHHIISDGWSSGVLMRELAQLYATDAPLPELPIQYADFAAWQRAWLSGETLDAQIAFWKTQLHDAPAQIELPFDRARPAMQTNVGAHQTFALPKSITDAFAALSRAENTTLFMTYLAAFQTLLYRYSGQTDFCIGTPIANRHRVETEGLIGFFVNTLVLRGDLSGEPTFRDVLQRARATTLDAYAHQDVPFEMIVNALELKRDLRYTPLFQVMFTFQNAARTRIEIPGITFDALDIETGLAMFDLTLTLSETSAGLLGNFESNTDLFDAATIARMIGHFETLLQSIAANPNLPLAHSELLSNVERDQLAAWNTTAAAFPREQCLHQLFENQVARTPDAIAARCVGRALTYRELNARANQLARHLQNLGAQPETRVGVCVERSLEMVIALLGILKSGAAYLPLDPTYPAERLAFMLEDSGAPIVVTQARVIEQFRNSQLVIRNSICLDSDWDIIARADESNPRNTATPENLAYVIYTSGSTGKPKGVMVEHRSVVNHNGAVARAFELSARDRVLQFATINFDAAIEEIFPALSVGATIVLRPAGAIPSGAELARLIETERISVLDLPTAYWHAWVFEMTLANARVPDWVRLLVLGGETASAERMAQWQRLGGEKIRWLNTYGPTEGTIIATLYDPARDARALDGRAIPIGTPIANAQIHLLDSNLQPVPIGVPGELHIGGVPVARGYLNRPELTAEKFIHYQLPFTNDSIRLYKTGDRARYRADGNLEFLGRADHQVKVRGMRVELGEIETTLEQHPAIQHAAVIARADGDVTRLVAYVAPRANLEGLDLREFLRAKLPDYAMPARFVPLDALPMLPSGKVDRRALPVPDISRDDTRDALEPRSRAEEILARVWSETLGIARVGIYDNFFELGGDSILAIQVIARAHQAGLALTPKQIFQQPTIAGLARVAGRARALDAEQASVTGAVPLTPIQRWFFEQNFVEPHHWNQTLLLQTRARLDRPTLEQAIAQVIAHHDALRMQFTRDQTGWRAHIAAMNDTIPFEWMDLQNASDPARAIETRAAELQASLNFENGFLLRAAYFDLGAAHGGRLLLIAHHLVIDGVAWRVLLEDVLSAYTRAPLPPKTTSFKRWAEKLNAYDARVESADWTNMLVGASRLPTDARGENTEASARGVTVALDADETRALLRDALAAHHADINAVLLTALAQALTRWTGSRTALIDVESHGRADLFDDVDVSRTVGWFTSVYPVQLQVDARAQPGEALRAIKEQLRRVPNHGIGYGVLRYVNAQLRDLVQPEITFNYLGQADLARAHIAQFDFAPEASGAARSPRNARAHLLDLNGGIADGCLRIEWTYSENIHRRATIERVARDFLDAVRALIRAAHAPDAIRLAPSDFPLAQISQRKLDQVLARVGSTR